MNWCKTLFRRAIFYTPEGFEGRWKYPFIILKKVTKHSGGPGAPAFWNFRGGQGRDEGGYKVSRILQSSSWERWGSRPLPGHTPPIKRQAKFRSGLNQTGAKFA